MLSPDTHLDSLPTVKPYFAVRLKKLELTTVRDLLFHFPVRYEDFTQVLPIAKATAGMNVTLVGTVRHVQSGRTFRKRVLLTEAILDDGTGTIRLLWFNQRFVGNTLRDGLSLRVSGKVTADKNGLLLSAPQFERASRTATHTGRLVPVYPETAGLTSKYLRYLIASLFEKKVPLADPIPKELLAKLHLPPLLRALMHIHFPPNEEAIQIARKRFAFDEMLLLQIRAEQVKKNYAEGAALPIPLNDTRLADFLALFPFTPTISQTRSIREIAGDLGRPHPMNRLLNGDVGSGKTLVAAAASDLTAAAGYQTALLAPTEVLARQHAETFQSLFINRGVSVALYTRSYQLLDGKKVARRTLEQAIHSGIPKIIVGTHALLEDNITFDALALVIVDEQHRFGVSQRAALQEKAFASRDGRPDTTPHFLAMTATPIPRTLSLFAFGSLELSFLDELPRERKRTITRIAVTSAAREKVYQFVRQEIHKGRQAFVIFPLVEESLALSEVKAAVSEYAKLEKDIFPTLSIGLIHGRLKAAEKEVVMRDFREKKYDILAATAVVEVGIDIPNATIIMIEEAERFGLSQLHQFRGRVGRGEHQSYCFLFPHEHPALVGSLTPEQGSTIQEISARLKILESCADGFTIAEEDLKLRGPGAFFGTRQSGLPDIAMENLLNVRLIAIARQEATALLTADPTLARHPLLAAALARFSTTTHLE